MPYGSDAVNDYESAKAYLSAGRNKNSRTLYSGGLNLEKVDPAFIDSDIRVYSKWDNMWLVMYHTNGTISINGLNGNGRIQAYSQSIRRLIAKYSGLNNVFTKAGKLYITEALSDWTQPKIQSCRQCKGLGRMDSICWGPGECYGSIEKCNTHTHETATETITENPDYRKHHAILCDHNRKEKHTLYRERECYSCRGTRRKDYGSKRISLAWDGHPLKIRDGQVVKQPANELEMRMANYVRL